MYLRGLVGGVIVQIHVPRGRGRGLCSQDVQESQELLLAVFRLGLGLDSSGLHIQAGKEGGGTMPDVFMGLVGGGLSRVQGQAGQGALQCQDLRLLKHGLHQGMRQMRCTVVWSRPTACSMRRLAQWEAPSGGGCSVRVSTSCICVSETSGGVRSRNRPSPRPPHNAPASATP